MANGRQQGKDPGILSAVQSLFGLAEVVVGLVGAVVDGKPELRLGCCLVLSVLWLLVILFDFWGWSLSWDAVVPGLIAFVGLAIMLTASLNKYAEAAVPLPTWVLWAGLGCLVSWCFIEIFSNLQQNQVGLPVPKFLDSEYSIAVAVALLISTPLWFVIVWR